MLSSIIGLVEVLTEDECNKIIAVLLAVHWCATLCSTASTSTTWFFEVCSYSWLDNDICPNLEVYFSLRILICSSDEVSEAMGYSEDAPVSLARDVRQNENCGYPKETRLLRRTHAEVTSSSPRLDEGLPSVSTWNSKKFGCMIRRLSFGYAR